MNTTASILPLVFLIMCVVFICFGMYKSIINSDFFYTTSYGSTIGVMDVMDNSFRLMKTLLYRSLYRYYINTNDNPYDIIRKVNHGDLTFGFIPLNVLYFGYNGIPINNQPLYINVEFVANLYEYPINLLTTDNSTITDFDDMKEKITEHYGVTIGLMNRYDHYYLLLDIFECYELDYQNMNIKLIQFDNIEDLYQSYNNTCDMIFYPCSHPNVLIARLIDKVYSHLISFNNIQCAKYDIDEHDMDKINKLTTIENDSGINPIVKYGKTHVHEMTINLKKLRVFYHALTLPNNQFFIRTFGTRMILIVNPDVKARYVNDIINRLIKNIDTINDEPYVKYITPMDLSVNPFPTQIITNRFAVQTYINNGVYVVK